MRKIIVLIATSADGYIARPDGGVEWLERPRLRGDYGMGVFYRSIDTILWGRKTYDVALDFQRKGIPGSSFDRRKAHFAFSRTPPADPAPGVVFVSEPLGPWVRRLRARRGKNIWMMGGAELIASFLDEGLIDEFIIHVIPTFIGEGIPLLAPRHRLVPLKLRSTRPYADGVVRLHYEVIRGRTRSAARGTGKRGGRAPAAEPASARGSAPAAADPVGSAGPGGIICRKLMACPPG